MTRAVHRVEAGNGEPLVFLHGVGGDSASWAPQIEAFSSGFRAIAWDMPGYGPSLPLDRMSFPALARRSMAGMPEAAYRAAIACLVAFDRRDALAGYRMPVLVLAGETDTNAPAPMMEKMAHRIPGAEYVCMAGTGHLGNLENPAAFNRAVGSFLGKRRS